MYPRGTGVDTLRTDGSIRDSRGVADPCNIDLTQLQATADDVRCTIHNALGLYDTFPLSALIGAQLIGWPHIEAIASDVPRYVADTLIALASMHQIWLRVGINID